MSPAEQRTVETECRRLSVAFAVNLDLRRYEAVARLFAPGAVYNPRGTEFVGPEGVMRYLLARPPGRRSRHIVTNHLIDVVSDSEAEGICFLIYYAFEGALPEDEPAPLAVPSIIGDYRDRYVLTQEGWKFAQRIGSVAFCAGT